MCFFFLDFFPSCASPNALHLKIVKHFGRYYVFCGYKCHHELHEQTMIIFYATYTLINVSELIKICPFSMPNDRFLILLYRSAKLSAQCASLLRISFTYLLVLIRKSF